MVDDKHARIGGGDDELATLPLATPYYEWAVRFWPDNERAFRGAEVGSFARGGSERDTNDLISPIFVLAVHDWNVPRPAARRG